MLSELKQGPVLVKVVLQAMKLKRPLPKAITEPPSVWPWLHVFYNAFIDLIDDRGYDGGMITWLARETWAKKHGLDEVGTKLLHTHVKALDIAFMAHKRDTQARGSNSRLGDRGDGKSGGLQRSDKPNRQLD